MEDPAQETHADVEPLTQALDIHCHILPCVDDGAASLAEALAMARISAADGITHITATPHCNRVTRMLRVDILPHVARLNEELVKVGIPLTILPGSEIQVATSAEYQRDYEAGVFCHLGGGRAFTLFEFSWVADDYPSDAADLIAWLVAQGTTPIVAHPERHPFFRDDPPRLRAVVEAGAWLQVTVDSLLGNHGAAAKTWGEKLLHTYDPIVLATDSHNVRRCSGLAPGLAWVRDHIGIERARALQARANQILASITQ
jgi:protein-tyrosine phosphatase